MLNGEKTKEMKESGIDISYEDDSSSEPDPRDDDRLRHRLLRGSIASSPVSLSSTTRSRAALNGRQRQRLRFQARLMLLKQQHEQSQECQKTSRRALQQSRSDPKNQSSVDNRGQQQIESDPKGDICEETSEFVSSSLSPEEQMKFNLLKMSLSSDVGYADDASPASSSTSISEMSEADQFLLGNVVEVKAVDELPEDISELLCHASYQEGVSGLIQHGKGKVLIKTSSSCPSETAAVPKYRGGRKKETAPPNMTAEQRVHWDKERQKKDNHNHIERRRRDKINDCIRVLSLIVPNGDESFSNSFLGESGNPDSQKKEYNKKGAVLEAAVSYIKRLQNEQKQMEEFRKQQEMLQRANRSLVLEIQQLQNRAQQVHISSPHLSPPGQVQQVLLHQYQPQFEPQSSLDQEPLQQQQQQQQPDMHLGSVQLLVSSPSHHPRVQPIEIQQQQQQRLQQDQENLFLDEFVSFVRESSSSECHPLVAGSCHFDGNHFETISENIFLDDPDNNFHDLSLMDDGFIDVIPDQAVAIGDYSVDDFFSVQSVQLNGDPLLSNATDIPMTSDFDDLFIPLALR